MRYAEEFCANHLEKIFYFCLRKTGGEQQAEELTSDISYEVLLSLSRGATPRSLSAWVWRIAKNRYARWAADKRRRAEIYCEAEFGEMCDGLPDDTDLEESLVLSEDVRLLRRELALIRSDYRRILVAHYIEDMSVSEIAREQNLPLGTVKTKLSNSRKRLKEGIQMAREFGKLSYKPKHISFVQNSSKAGSHGEDAWSYINRLLPKNLLIAAYRNPMTAEELALELGVAMPYLEEEIAILEKAGLLAKSGGRYEPTFYIMSCDAQRKILEFQAAATPELTAALEAFVDTRNALYTKNGIVWHGGWQSAEDMKWTLLMRAVDLAEYEAGDEFLPKQKLPHTKRADGGEWDVVGYEECPDPRPAFVGLHGCYADVNFGMYKFRYKNLCDKTPDQLDRRAAETLDRLCRSGMDGCDAADLAELEALGFVTRSGGGYAPALLVVNSRYGFVSAEGLPDEDVVALRRLWDNVLRLMKALWSFNLKTIRSEVPERLQSNARALEDAYRSTVTDIRGAVLEQALRDGWIACADDDPRRTLGVYIVID